MLWTPGLRPSRIAARADQPGAELLLVEPIEALVAQDDVDQEAAREGGIDMQRVAHQLATRRPVEQRFGQRAAVVAQLLEAGQQLEIVRGRVRCRTAVPVFPGQSASSETPANTTMSPPASRIASVTSPNDTLRSCESSSAPRGPRQASDRPGAPKPTKSRTSPVPVVATAAGSRVPAIRRHAGEPR